MSNHAKLSPSSAHRWLQCAASVTLTAPHGYVIEETVNPAATLGTLLHERWQRWAETGKIDYSGLEFKDEKVLKSGIDAVESILDPLDDAYDLYPEQVVGISREIYGTADLIIDADEALIVIDYKSGHGEVEIQQNPQLAIYGLGALRIFGRDRPLQMVIVQPRSRQVIKKWEIAQDTIVSWERTWREKLKHAQGRINSLRWANRFNAGTWCKYCPVAMICPENLKYLLELSMAESRDFSDQVCDLTSSFDQIHLMILEKREMLLHNFAQIENHLLRRAQAGKLKGWTVEENPGKRSWIDVEKTIKALERHYAPEEFVTVKKQLKVMADIERLAGVSFVERHTKRGESALKLAPAKTDENDFEKR